MAGASVESPILKLYPDIWTCITIHLNFPAVLRLLEIGNARLSSILCGGIVSSRLVGSGPALDIECWLRTCNRFSSIKELRLEPSTPKFVKLPSGPSNFYPPTLTTLSFQFPGVFSHVASLKLANLVPGLLHLIIDDAAGMTSSRLSQLELPPLLQSLDLIHAYRFPNYPSGFVASLPRSLTRLVFGYSGCNSEEIHSNDWPPSLAYLALFPPPNADLSFECLPRTVTELSIRGGLNKTSTTFPRSKSGLIVFPWRRFFPRLHTLILPDFLSGMDYELLMDTILGTEPNSALFDDFISSVFGDAPDLLTPPSQPILTYQTLKLPLKIWDLTPSTLEAMFERLAPYLVHTDILRIKAPAKAVHFVPSASICISTIPKGFSLPLPPRLEHLVAKGHVPVTSLPSSLLYLECEDIDGTANDQGAFGPHDVLPPNLRDLTLNTYAYLPQALIIMSTTLTRLSMNLESSEAWNLVAERLINLKELSYHIWLGWGSDEPLSPFSSSTLHSFNIHEDYDRIERKTKPKLCELFSSELTIFPASLELLSLYGEWHATLLAHLPPSLTSLYVSTLIWDEDGDGNVADSSGAVLYAYTTPNGLNNAAILKALPPTLKGLSLYGSHLSIKLMGAELIQLLPPSLTGCSCLDLFNVKGLTESDIWALVPTKKARWSIERFLLEIPVSRPAAGFFPWDPESD